MLHFLLAVHFLLALSIIGLILLQKHDSDGALGSSGGGAASGMFSVRGQANLLTRTTAVLMTIFVLNCLALAKIVKTMPSATSVIDRVNEAPMPTDGTPLSGFVSKKKADDKKAAEKEANKDVAKLEKKLDKPVNNNSETTKVPVHKTIPARNSSKTSQKEL